MEGELAVEEGPDAGAATTLTPGRTVLVGRGPGATWTLRDPGLAPCHLAVRLEENGLQVMNMVGPGAVALNDAPLAPLAATEAFGGDALRLGGTLLRLTLLGGARRRRPREGPLEDPAVPAEEFALERVLGRGASGVVYAAQWRPHGRRVALKVLDASVLPGSADHERFVRECRTVARLRSPYVVAVHDLRTHAGRAFGVLELVEGPSLRDALKQGPLPVAHALRAAEDVARALAAAAEHGIVHRDVKPANVLLCPSGVAKLCDFGVAKDFEASLRSLTVSGMGLGTMAYMPPEQLGDAKHVEPSADVYSLGATLYHLLAGKPPFLPTTPEQVALAATQEPPLVASLRPDCPREVAALVHALLAKDSLARPLADEVAGALEALRARLYPGAEVASLFARAR